MIRRNVPPRFPRRGSACAWTMAGVMAFAASALTVVARPQTEPGSAPAGPAASTSPATAPGKTSRPTPASQPATAAPAIAGKVSSRAFVQSRPATAEVQPPGSTSSTTPSPTSAATRPASQAAFAPLLPVWTTGYIEIKDLGAILGASTRATRPAATRPAEPPTGPEVLNETLEELDDLVKKTLGLGGREFTTEVLSRHFALAWGGPSQPNQFALLCQPRNLAGALRLLEAAKAAPVPTSNPKQTKIYRLNSKNLRAAVFGDTLVIATVGETGDTGMFYAIVDLAEGGRSASLAQNALFNQALRGYEQGWFCLVAVTAGRRPPEGTFNRIGSIVTEVFNQLTFASAAATSVPRKRWC